MREGVDESVIFPGTRLLFCFLLVDFILVQVELVHLLFDHIQPHLLLEESILGGLDKRLGHSLGLILEETTTCLSSESALCFSWCWQLFTKSHRDECFVVRLIVSSFLWTTFHLFGPPCEQLLDFLLRARPIIAVFIGCLLGTPRVLRLSSCSGLSNASIVFLTLEALLQIRLLLVRVDGLCCHSHRLWSLWKMQGDKEMDHVV